MDFYEDVSHISEATLIRLAKAYECLLAKGVEPEEAMCLLEEAAESYPVQ